LVLLVVLLCSISLSRRYTDGKGKSLDRWDSSVCQARMDDYGLLDSTVCYYCMCVCLSVDGW
jgi:hypothetical protein